MISDNYVVYKAISYYSDIVDGEECYAINQFHSTQWYSKQTGLKVKSKDPKKINAT